MIYTQESAEALALQVLGWIAGQDDLMPTFMGATGAAEADIKAQVADPDFLGAVLDFLMLDDAWVVAFCDVENLPYDRPMAARAALPGGAEIHWT